MPDDTAKDNDKGNEPVPTSDSGIPVQPRPMSALERLAASGYRGSRASTKPYASVTTRDPNEASTRHALKNAQAAIQKDVALVPTAERDQFFDNLTEQVWQELKKPQTPSSDPIAESTPAQRIANFLRQSTSQQLDQETVRALMTLLRKNAHLG